ncbi:MAG: type VI secretion system-associated FHA domain protein TagH, partial [Rhodocyclaceae bacterium]|nr:type VI secretion system-associated FHA domain protein TagH [Rhodocyclaceae bacterium]
SPPPPPPKTERLVEPPQIPASTAAPATSASSDELIAALKRGLKAGELPLEGPLTPQMMENIGALIRESTQGTLDLLLARAMTKREVRAEVTMIVSRGNNPLKFSPNIGMALSHLFGPPRKGFMTPTEAMRDAYNDLRSHQFGFMAGMRAALEGVLKRFTPETLERRLTKKSVVDSLLPMNRKAKLWDLYNEMYHEISREAEDDFHTLFGKEFLRAYEEQIERLEEAQDGPR